VPVIEISEFYIELMGFLLTLIIGMSIKEWVVSFIEGMKFKYNKAFNEGDKVLLDGQHALIIKIGFSETVFGVYGKDGYTWRYIPNKKIKDLKLEKIVDPDLHPDSKEERAARIREMMGHEK
tara:strand:- start:272 stop:637 length:366 start_codon:yes stop_codon:yes gene_type:complete